MLLAEKVALITGAGNGIGRATAVRFAQEGAKLIICDLDEAGLESTQQEVAAAGGEAIPVIGSVAVRADVQNMVDAALHQFDRLDILINNAGFRCRIIDLADIAYDCDRGGIDDASGFLFYHRHRRNLGAKPGTF